MNNKKITNGTKYDYMTPAYWAAYKKRKPIVIREEQKTSILPLIGGLMIGFAILDFVMSFAGVNLTSFLGPASRFSPIVLGLIGSALLNSK